MKLPTKSMFVAAASLGLLLELFAPAAFSQQPPGSPPVRVRGTVEKADAKTLTVKTADGTSSFTLAPNVLFATRKPATLKDIKPGDFVASAAVKGADGKLHSTELRIFPEAMRGAGEGQRPMNTPDTMMTNATVTAVVVPPSEVVVAPEGRVVKVKYKDGESELVVGPEVKIVALVATDLAQLQPGMDVSVTSTKAADGSLTATVINAN